MHEGAKLGAKPSPAAPKFYKNDHGKGHGTAGGMRRDALGLVGLSTPGFGAQHPQIWGSPGLVPTVPSAPGPQSTAGANPSSGSELRALVRGTRA